MPLDPEAFADMVIQTIETALAKPLERLAVLESKWATLGDLRDRLVAMETKAVPAADVAALLERVIAIDARTPTRELWDGLAKRFGDVETRCAVLETRAPVPGPAGAPGVDGKDGVNGVDGLGFDDLDVKFDGYNMLTLEFARGTEVKAFPFSLPFLRYEGVYKAGEQYEKGDVVTFGGSTFHCNAQTRTRPEESKDWTLMVKRGRDGKDGRDGRDLAPVVKVS